jgi:Icc-related predicted phosphoesterase
MSDPHGDVEAIKRALNFGLEQQVNAYFLGGDIINNPWENDEQAKNYLGNYKELQTHAERIEFKGTIFELVNKIVETGKGPKTIANAYLTLCGAAKEGMRRAYSSVSRAIEEILDDSDSPFLVLPGNYDNLELMASDEGFGSTMHLNTQSLKSLNSKTREMDNVRISGYGSADVFPGWIPRHLICPYGLTFEEVEVKGNDGKTEKGVQVSSEAVDYFVEQHPDVVWTHNPPQGIKDEILNGQSRVKGNTASHAGDPAMLHYLMESNMKDEGKNAPKLWLVGHIHEDRIHLGAKKVGKTFFVNPGKVGRLGDGIGTFSIIDMDGAQPAESRIYLFHGEKMESVNLVERAYNTSDGFAVVEIDPQKMKAAEKKQNHIILMGKQ